MRTNGEYWSRRTAEALLLELQTSAGKPAAPRLSEWIDRCAVQRNALAVATKKVNRIAGEYLTRYFSTDPRISQIDREQAASWRAALASGELSPPRTARQSTPKPLQLQKPGEQTICKHVRSARKIFAEAVDQGLIEINPFDRLRGTPPAAVREWAYLDFAAIGRVLAACPNAPWRAYFGLLRFAGLRQGEALRLRWSDVDFPRNRICVNAAGTISAITNKQRPRTVPIETRRWPTGLTALLQAARESAGGAALVCAGVCPHKRSARIVASAGIARYKGIHHTLRKNAEMDLAAVFPMHVICEWAGHSIAVSAVHYLRVPEELYQPPQFAPSADRGPEL